MVTHEWFNFHDSENATYQVLLHQSSIFKVLVHVSILGFLTILETPYSILEIHKTHLRSHAFPFPIFRIDPWLMTLLD